MQCRVQRKSVLQLIIAIRASCSQHVLARKVFDEQDWLQFFCNLTPPPKKKVYIYHLLAITRRILQCQLLSWRISLDFIIKVLAYQSIQISWWCVGFRDQGSMYQALVRHFALFTLNFDLLISRFLWTEDCFSSVPGPDIHGHLVHWLVCTRSWRLLSCNPYMWSYKFVISESLVFFAWDAKIVCILKLHLIIWFRNPLRWWLSGLLVCCSESILLVTLASCLGQEE